MPCGVFVVPVMQRSFDRVAASLRAAATALRMTVFLVLNGFDGVGVEFYGYALLYQVDGNDHSQAVGVS
jgi:hypothetical protein